MKTSEYLLACCFATCGALAVVFLLWLISLISWAIVWAVLSFAFIPVAQRAMKFYQDNDCYSIDDFLEALMNYSGEPGEGTEESHNINSIR